MFANLPFLPRLLGIAPRTTSKVRKKLSAVKPVVPAARYFKLGGNCDGVQAIPSQKNQAGTRDRMRSL